MTIKSPVATNSREINFQHLLNIILMDKWLIATMACSLLFLGTLFLILRPALYQTSAIIQVENRPNKITSDADRLALLYSRPEAMSDIDAALMKSRFILDGVIDKLALDVAVTPNSFPIIGKLAQLFKDKPIVKIDLFQIRNNTARQKFKLIFHDNTHYTLLDNKKRFVLSGAIGKITHSKDGSISLRILSAKPATTYILTKLSHESALRSLTKSLKIEDVEGGTFNQFGKTGILKVAAIGTNPQKITQITNSVIASIHAWDRQRKAIDANNTLTFLYQQLPQIQKDLQHAENAFKEFSIKNNKIDLNEESRKLFTELQAVQHDITATSWNEKLLLQDLTDKHPDVIALQEKLKLLNLHSQELQRELNQLPNYRMVAESLLRDIKMQNTLYLQLLREIQEFKIAAAGADSHIRILSPALLPDEPIPSNFFVKWVLLLCVSLSLGILCALVRRRFRGRIYYPEWAEQTMQIPTITTIPFDKMHETYSKTLKPPVIDESVNAAFQDIFTFLQLSTHKKKIISILGPASHIGKSFIASHLARIIAEMGQTVLLIDADMRQGKLESHFQLPKSPGLSEILIDALELDKAIQKTSYANLNFIASGYYPKKPSELLLRDKFNKILASQSDKYHYIILDMPPTTVADCLLIAKQADINLMVIGADCHRPEELENARKRLNLADIHIQGSIYNMAKKNSYGVTYARFYETAG